MYTLKPNMYTLKPNMYTLKPNMYTLKPYFAQVVTEDERLNIRSINDLAGGGEPDVAR
jgi:hypothetical protein